MIMMSCKKYSPSPLPEDARSYSDREGQFDFVLFHPDLAKNWVVVQMMWGTPQKSGGNQASAVEATLRELKTRLLNQVLALE